MVRAGSLTILPLLLATGCVSLWQQQDHQAVAWSDGGTETIEVWLRQGSMTIGQPWLFLLDLVATPLLVPVEVIFAGAAASSPDARIAWGPLGFVASLLPGITCMPIDNKPSAWLLLSKPLPLPAAERDTLRALSGADSVEWLAGWCDRVWGAEHPHLARNVRTWVAEVALGPPEPKAGQ